MRRQVEPAPLRRPASVSPTAATSSPGRSAVVHRRKGGPPLPGPTPGTAASVPLGCTPSCPAWPFRRWNSLPVLMGEGCGLSAVPSPTKVVVGAPPTPPIANGRLPQPTAGFCCPSKRLQKCLGIVVRRHFGEIGFLLLLLPGPPPPASCSNACIWRLPAPSAAPSARRARPPDAPVQPSSPPAL